MSFFERWTKMKVAEGEKSSGSSSSQKSQPESQIKSQEEGKIFFTYEEKRTKPISEEDALAPFLIKPKEGVVATDGTERVSTPSREIDSVPTEPGVETVSASVESKGETTPKPTDKPKKQRKSVKKPIQSKREAVPVPVELEKKEEPLKKGDVFENTTNGETIFVEGEETRQDMPGILYTEAYLGGTLKNEGKVMWKPAEGFRVLIRGEEMKKNDPIKETDPEFYAVYGEQMTKVENAFNREVKANRTMIQSWRKFIDEESGIGEGEVFETKEEKKEMLDYVQSIEKKIDGIVEEYNELDDRIMSQGREEFKLLDKIRDLEKKLPDYALEMKVSELKRLEKEQGTDEPDVELIEKGYQTILLERKKEAIAERYNAVVDSSTVVAQDMPILNDFLKQINKLYLSINEESSSENIKGVLSEMAVIEEQMFAKKEKNNDEKSDVIGGFVRNKKGNQGEGGNGNGNGRGRKGNTGSNRATRPQSSIGTNEEESLVLSGAISQAEQSGKSISQEQRQTAFDTKKKIEELIREKKLLAKGIFEDPENIGKISKGKYKLHVGFLDDLGDSAKKPFRNVNIAELQAILEKVKGVEFKREEFVAPKKVIETPVVSASEKPKEKSFEDLLKNFGRDEEESRKKLEVLRKVIEDRITNIKNKIGEQEVRANKEKCINAFVEVVKKHVSSTWTQSEQELFSRTFIERCFDDFVK